MTGAVPVSAHERREQIRQEVRTGGYVRIEQLATTHGVSVMTIHRDLDALQEQGWLQKIRGGATAAPSAMLESSVRARMADAAEEKTAIAGHATNYLSGAQVVGIDDSTSALAVAEHLPAHGPLTVVSNFLSVVNLLSGEAGINLIGLGGEYHPTYDAFLGLHTADMARSMRTDVLFMSTTAVVDGHCLHRSQETVQVKRALMETSANRILLLDHTKFERRAVHELAPLTAFDTVIVDSATPPGLRSGLTAAGVHIEVAGT